MLSKLSVKKPYTVIVAVVLVLLLGYLSVTDMTTDLLPNMNMPYAMVMTTYAGASPEEVEMTVTKAIEQSMATVSNIENVSSVSSENMSIVILEFNQSANMDSVTIEMRESLDQIRSYWNESVGNPIIMKMNPDMMPVIVAAVDADNMSGSEITELVKKQVAPELESIEGVASVSQSGNIEESVQVILRQEKIDELNESIKASLDQKFAEAENKLQEAQAGISSGKQKLEEGKSQMNSQLTVAQQAFVDAKLKLLEGELTLEGKKTQLQQQEQQMLQAAQTIPTQEAALVQAETLIREAEASLQKLADQKAELTEQKAAIEANTNMSEADKMAALATIENGMKQLENAQNRIPISADQLRQMKEALQSSKAELEKAKSDMEAGKAAIAAGRQMIEQAEGQLESGKGAIQDQVGKMSEGQAEAAKQMEQASDKLQQGEQQLNQQKIQFESGKDAAYEQADAGKIVTMDMVKGALQAQNFSMPAGYVTEDGSQYLVRVGNKLESTEDLQNLVLLDMDMEGVEPVKMSDIADVVVTDNSSEVYAKINGNHGIMLSIQKQTGYSTGEVTKKIKTRCEQLMKDDKAIHVTTLMDQGVYIDLVVDSVVNNMLMGGGLAVLILLLFLRNLKPTFVIACSIPISILFAMVLMYFSGITLNIISLSGLALGVGMLVDNSIVVIENIYRMRNEGVPAREAAVEGARQVAGAIAASTLTTVSVFAPIVFSEGVTRQLFVDMGLTIAYSLLASLIVALTLVPMMGAGLLSKTKEKDHKILDRIQEFYGVILEKSLRLKPIVFLAVIALLVLSAVGAASRGTAFIPAMESTQVSVTLEVEQGTKFEDLSAMTDQVMDSISEIEDIESIGAMAGGDAMMGMMGGGQSSGGEVRSTSFYVILKEDKKESTDTIAKQITEKNKDIGGELTVNTSNMDMSALGGSGISVQIKGKELDRLQQIAGDMANILKETEGTQEVSDGMEEKAPEFRISIDKAKASAHQLTVAQVFKEINAKLAAAKTSTVLATESKDYDVMVMSGENEALTRPLIEEMTIPAKNASGETIEVPLKEIADFTDANGMASIKRDAQQRYITVSAKVDADHNIGLLGNEIEKKIEQYDLSDGYEIELTGENENINESMTELLKMLVLAVLFMYLIMVAQFQSLLSPFIIMFTIPLAFTGGFMGLYIGNMEISVIAMIGFVMLAGIIVNNGIVLVDYINQLRIDGMGKKEAIIEAGKTRLRPIIMTALTTILGLSTMAAGVGMGSDMVQPMAVVTIGGLIYGTVLTLIVVPCIYDLLNRQKK